MSKFIFGHYYGGTSITSDSKPNLYNGRGEYACKYVEIFYLWYLYVRNYLPSDYHIFITDACSPIKIDWMLEKIDEPIQILEEGDMNLDFSKKLHIRKFNPIQLNHQQGWIKVTKDWWKICIHNNIDFFTVESDGLVAYDISKDIENKDFIFRSDNPYKGTVYYIKNELVHKPIGGMQNMTDYLNHLDTASQRENHLGTSEGGMIAIGQNAIKPGHITNKQLIIQDCSVERLKSFLISNPIKNDKHKMVETYLNNLK